LIPTPRRLTPLLFLLTLLAWTAGGPPTAHAQLSQPPTALPAEGADGSTDGGIHELYFEGTDGTLTLYAEDASVLDILRLLREKHGVDVVVPGLEDARVSVTLKQVRLDDALRRILPEGARFHFDAGEAELELEGQAEPRRGLRTEFPSHAPPKGQAREPERDVMKLPADKETRGRPDGDVVKADAESIKVPLGEGPKLALDRSPEPGSHGRVGLHLGDDGTIRVTDFQRVAGELARGDRPAGSLIFAAFVGGNLVQVGSQADPFELHAYTEQGPHSHLRATEGDIRIALSDRVADPAALAETVVVLYQLDESLAGDTGHPLPETLTPETFERFRPYLREVINGSDKPTW